MPVKQSQSVMIGCKLFQEYEMTWTTSKLPDATVATSGNKIVDTCKAIRWGKWANASLTPSRSSSPMESDRCDALLLNCDEFVRPVVSY
jgi:hypothetical protein